MAKVITKKAKAQPGAGLPKKSFFATEYPEIRTALNVRMGIETTISIAKLDTKNLNVREVCVACMYLVHNLVRDPHGPLPNIDSLSKYDLSKFTYADTLVPYAKYLLGGAAESKRGRKKGTAVVLGPGVSINGTSAVAAVENEKKRTIEEIAQLFDYTTSLIRYLFILQTRDARREPTPAI